MERHTYISIYKEVADVYKHVLLNTEDGEKALNYLKERGFTIETIQHFELGYSFKGNMITNYLKAKGYDLDVMVEIGLLRKFDKEPIYRDVFYGRIMIPIHDSDGNIIAFSGRTLPHNTMPIKYLNTGETKYFKKGEVLYNLHNAKNSIEKFNFALVMEGYFDSIITTQKVSENVISTMGTALNLEQVYKLKQFTNRVILVFDGDSAGLEATKRNAQIMLQHGLDVRIAIVPNGFDPHDFLMKNDKQVFAKEIIGKVKTYYGFMMEYLKNGKNMSNEIDRMIYMNEMLGVIQLAPNELGKALFVQLTNELCIDYNLINFHLDNLLKIKQ